MQQCRIILSKSLQCNHGKDEIRNSKQTNKQTKQTKQNKRRQKTKNKTKQNKTKTDKLENALL